MERLRFDFNFSDSGKLNVLKKLGYTYRVDEGGWVSGDGSTIIIEHREPYIKQVMCFDGNEKLYLKNVERLEQFGLVGGICGNCSQANKWEDSTGVLKCECSLSDCYNTPVLKNERCGRHRKATKDWIRYLNG